MTSGTKRQRVDWEAVWKSLNWDDNTRRQATETLRLRQRAQQYAAPITAPDDLTEAAYTILSFDLGAETYSIDVALVRGVRPLTGIVRVPGVPDFYVGVVNVRGRVLTVMDLRRFFGLDAEEDFIIPDELVIIRANNLEVGLLAHQVNGVMTIPQNSVKPLDNLPYARGITPDKIIMLDIERLFTDDQIVVTGKHD